MIGLVAWSLSQCPLQCRVECAPPACGPSCCAHWAQRYTSSRDQRHQRRSVPAHTAGHTSRTQQVFLLRTTAASLLDPNTRAAAAVLNIQLDGALHLLVDTTMCASTICDPAALNALALGLGLGASAWGYTAVDVANSWPMVEWPVFDVHKPPTTKREARSNMDKFDDRYRCWLMKKVSLQLEQLQRTRWPIPSGETDGFRLATSHWTPRRHAAFTDSGALTMVNYLIHEPSVLLWWRAHAKRLEATHLWVVEEDTLYGDPSARPFLDAYANSSADLVSVFCHFDGACSVARGRGGFRGRFRDDTRPVRGSTPVAWDAPPRRAGAHHWEHIVRFSARMLASLEGVLNSSKVAHGEEFASALCASQSWCTMADLRETRSHSDTFRDGRKLHQGLPHQPQWYHVKASARCELLHNWSIGHGGALASTASAHCAGDRAGTTRLIDLRSRRAMEELKPVLQMCANYTTRCSFLSSRNHSKFPAGFTLLSFLDWSSLREMEKRLNRSLSMAEYWEFRFGAVRRARSSGSTIRSSRLTLRLKASYLRSTAGVWRGGFATMNK